MSYDITYCNSDCELTQCFRHVTRAPEDRDVTQADLSDNCPDYTPPPMAA